MAALVRTRSLTITGRLLAVCRPLSISASARTEQQEAVTHTGQQFQDRDYRKARFIDKTKLVNPNFAIELIQDDPVVVCDQRTIFSDGGGALGHPKVYINLDKPEVHICGYSGRKFVHKDFYDEKTMGPSITHDAYLKQIMPTQRD